MNPSSTEANQFDIQQELNHLEDMILQESLHLPLTGWTVIDEEKILDQLDRIRVSLPDAFAQALAVLRRKEEILLETEEYAEKVIANAQRRAEQLLDETGIIRQAEREAQRLQTQVKEECQQLERKTQTDLEQQRRTLQQELDQLRQNTIRECEEIQRGSDDYAQGMLSNLEKDLKEMLQVVQNGRRQLSGRAGEVANAIPARSPAPNAANPSNPAPRNGGASRRPSPPPSVKGQRKRRA